jgi:hypothetical protein
MKAKPPDTITIYATMKAPMSNGCIVLRPGEPLIRLRSNPLTKTPPPPRARRK